MNFGSSRTRSSNRLLSAIWSLHLLPALAIVSVGIGVLHSCSNKPTETVVGTFDPENFATMTSTQVSTLISDSGITRYRIDTPLWLMFDQASEPRWTFPKGMHLEKYDNFFRIDATVDCDSATYFKEKQLWRLDGYVDITNMSNEKFLTQQLFWDQKNQKIYSDSFIHIERADRIIEGYGFVSNDKMTQYHVVNVSGIFPVEQDKETSADTARQQQGPTDSLGVPLSATPTVQGRPGLRPTLPRASQQKRISPASTQEKDVQPAKTTNSAPPMPARNTQPVRVKKLDPTHKLTPIKDSEPSKPKRPARRPKKHQSS